jgi:hypothetical protein
MTKQEYLKEISKQQSLLSDSDEIKVLRSERDKVEKLLRESFKESSIAIQYAGSYAKGTMIRDSYDLDIVCYFNHDDESAGKTLEEIFNKVKESLEPKYYVVTKKSTLRLKSLEVNLQNLRIDFHIDVVPGRFTDDKKQDVFLYQSSGEKQRLKTNLQKHINYIKESGLLNTIKLAKFWKKRIGLDSIKTFILELLVIESLGKLRDTDGLDECLKEFWEQIRDNIKNLKIEDPANPTGNDLSELFDETTKTTLSAFATNALNFVENDNWESIFGTVESMSDDEKVANVGAAILLNSNRPKPWCDIT